MYKNVAFFAILYPEKLSFGNKFAFFCKFIAKKFGNIEINHYICARN